MLSVWVRPRCDGRPVGGCAASLLVCRRGEVIVSSGGWDGAAAVMVGRCFCRKIHDGVLFLRRGNSLPMLKLKKKIGDDDGGWEG